MEQETHRCRQEASKAQRAVLNLFDKVLAPLVRLAITHRIPERTINHLVRRAFVRVAHSEYPRGSRGQTKSRISMLTGVGRSDIQRMLEEVNAGTLPDPNDHTRAVRVIRAWCSEPEFLDQAGEPVSLPLRGADGSFEALVRKYASTIPAHTLLDELVYAGNVEYVDADRVKLVTKEYVPADAGSAALVQVLARGAARLLETGRHNIQRAPTGEEPPFFERQFWVPAVPPHRIEEYRSRLHECLRRCYKETLAIAEEYEDDFAQEGYHRQAGFGMYYFEEERPTVALNNLEELDES